MSNQSTLVNATRRKIRKGAKYDYNFVEIAARMVAAGMTVTEVGYWLGVKPTTIKQWKARYPEFKAATDNKSNAKAIAHAHLVASGLRAAMGYDFEEIETVMEPGTDEDGEPCMVVKSEKKKLKHRPPDKDLLQFFLINLGNEYKNHKTIQIETTKKEVNVHLTGVLESDDIRKLAGAAVGLADRQDKQRKRIESTAVEVIGDGTDSSEKVEQSATFVEASVPETKISADVNDDDFISSLTDDD
jgi:hypothetical protein